MKGLALPRGKVELRWEREWGDVRDWGWSWDVLRAQGGSVLHGWAELGRGMGSTSAVGWGFLVVVAGWLVFLGCFFCLLTPFWAGC